MARSTRRNAVRAAAVALGAVSVGVLVPSIASANPYSDCIVYSDVYKTGTDGGRANGKVEIVCRAAYPSLRADTELWRYQSGGWRIMDIDNSTAGSASTPAKYVASISIERCQGDGTHQYNVLGVSQVRGWDNKVYKTNSDAYEWITC